MTVKSGPSCALALLAVGLCGSATPAVASSPSPCVPQTAVHVGRPTGAQETTGALTVASLNMAGQPAVADGLTAWTTERALDVLLLQEVGNESHDGGAFVRDLGDRLDMAFAYAPATVFETGTIQGLAIVSRYPLSDIRIEPLAYHRLRFRSRCRIALAATVHGPDGPVRVVNVHLDTRINSRSRIAQLTSALEAATPFDGPRIIGGDFNTANVGWFRSMWPLPYMQRQWNAVHTWLSSAGFHTPFTTGPPTFRVLGLKFRLDWIYVKDVQTLEWGVDHVPVTDHRGVWARLDNR